MNNAFDQFRKDIGKVREIDSLYYYLKNKLQLPNDLTDLLRSEIVYSTSALDKLIHELVRIGMIDIFCNRRIATNRFKNYTISMSTYNGIISSTIQPQEYWFEQEVINKHKHLSFQDPQKISEALSLIWDEEHKWQKIAIRMYTDQRTIRTQLKNIVSRRNQIVHESDLDSFTGVKNRINQTDTKFIVDFIEMLGEAIYEEVK
ncbi:MAG: HEPN domain-containing protein [Bacteroidota bacterium]